MILIIPGAILLATDVGLWFRLGFRDGCYIFGFLIGLSLYIRGFKELT